MIKKIAYKLLDIVTFGKGINRNFEGNSMRLPTRYFRYFPDGYEKENFTFINQYVRENMIVLDIGAHIGLTTIAFAKRAGDGGKVYSFEPTPSTVEVLRKTIQLNGLKNVSVEPYAIAEKKGTLTFYISDNNVDNSNSLFNNHREDRRESTIEVKVDTVDDFMRERQVPRVDFIKIDAEGAELQVLKGALKTIEKYKPKILLSIHPKSIRNFGDSQAEIWDVVNRSGYSMMVDGKKPGREEFTAMEELFEVYLT